MGAKKNLKTFHQEFNLPWLAKDSPGDDRVLCPLFSWDQPCPCLSHQMGSPGWQIWKIRKRVTSINLGYSERESQTQEVRQPALLTTAGTD